MSKKFWIDRLKEPSTWRGLAMLALGFGVSVAPESLEAIVAAGTGVAGLIGVVTQDKRGG
ncbi:MAG: hypothetical protein HQM02_08635 [Magnetococcales bacterium]|nr:hypothetical protein [Magnetococcales bacterium]